MFSFRSVVFTAVVFYALAISTLGMARNLVSYGGSVSTQSYGEGVARSLAVDKFHTDIFTSLSKALYPQLPSVNLPDHGPVFSGKGVSRYIPYSGWDRTNEIMSDLVGKQTRKVEDFKNFTTLIGKDSEAAAAILSRYDVSDEEAEILLNASPSALYELSIFLQDQLQSMLSEDTKSGGVAEYLFLHGVTYRPTQEERVQERDEFPSEFSYDMLYDEIAALDAKLRGKIVSNAAVITSSEDSYTVVFRGRSAKFSNMKDAQHFQTTTDKMRKTEHKVDLLVNLSTSDRNFLYEVERVVYGALVIHARLPIGDQSQKVGIRRAFDPGKHIPLRDNSNPQYAYVAELEENAWLIWKEWSKALATKLRTVNTSKPEVVATLEDSSDDWARHVLLAR